MNTLVVLIGPTAVGKTDTSIAIAEHFACPIVSADSRQMYKGMVIGTAMPSEEELKKIEEEYKKISDELAAEFASVISKEDR